MIIYSIVMSILTGFTYLMSPLNAIVAIPLDFIGNFDIFIGTVQQLALFFPPLSTFLACVTTLIGVQVLLWSADYVLYLLKFIRG